MNTAYIYARVSTEEQAEEGKSIETQEKVARRWAKDNGYTILEVFKDEGKSATNINRPALKDLLTKCQENPVSAILVQDTDRLARNTLDHLTIRNILKKKSTVLISISQPMLDDSPEGNLMDTMIASFNTFQSQITGRKTSKVLEEKARMGWYPGGIPPLGYMNIVNPNPTSTLDKQIIGINDTVASYVKKIFEMYATGNYSIYDIAEYLNKKGIKSNRGYKIHPSLIATKLKDEFYIGSFLWNGKKYQGKHPLFISQELFEKVQQVIQAHNQNATRKRKHSFLLRGFIICGDCGRRMLGDHHVKPNGLVFDLYFCPTCKRGSYTDMVKLEKRVEKVFQKIKISNEYVSSVLAVAERLLQENRTNEDSERDRLLKLKSKLEKAIRDAEDSRFIHHTLSEEAFLRIYSRYESQLKDINEGLESVDKDHSKNIQVLGKILRLAENIGQAYTEADDHHRRLYLGLFIKSFNIRNGRVNRFALSDDVKPLIENGSVRVSNNGLRD